MLMLLVLLFFIIVFARIGSGYSNNFSSKKYFTVKSKFLAKVLIENNKQVSAKDKNKLSLFSTVFYSLALIILVLAAVLLLLPKTECTPLVIDITRFYIYANTVNLKLPLGLAVMVLCAEIFTVSLKLIFTLKTVKKVLSKVAIFILLAGLCLASLSVFAQMVFELIKM